MIYDRIIVFLRRNFALASMLNSRFNLKPTSYFEAYIAYRSVADVIW